MRVRRVKLLGSTQQLIDLLHSRRRHIGISRQGLSDKGVGLHLVEQLLPLKCQCMVTAYWRAFAISTSLVESDADAASISLQTPQTFCHA